MKLTAHPLAEGLPAPVDQQLVLRLRISLARMLVRGDAFAATFYGLLFERHPSMRSLFPQDIALQRAKFTQMLVWIVTHLDRPDDLLPAVRELGRRHAGYGASREHFSQLREVLIEAMSQSAADEWTDRLAEDWRLSIDLIAGHMLSSISTTPH